jgi:lycopene elongase/hydratase (dihydrobisanhydrobacterioruberin-forming)
MSTGLSVRQKLMIPIAVSRPRFWMYLLGPALIGIASQPDPAAWILQWQHALFVLVWTLPANVFLYGCNDLADADTDDLNAKKEGYEHKLRQQERRMLHVWIAACVLSVVGSAALLQSPATLMWTALFLVLGAAYSLPPIRFKARPFLDCLSNVLYVLPGFAVAASSGLSPSLAVVIGAWAWSASMHVFSAIPDIVPDRSAGIRTTAVVLGMHKTLLFCAGLWAVAAFSALSVPALGWAALAAVVYPGIALALASRRSPDVFAVYTKMPLLNTLVGGILFWAIIV